MALKLIMSKHKLLLTIKSNHETKQSHISMASNIEGKPERIVLLEAMVIQLEVDLTPEELIKLTNLRQKIKPCPSPPASTIQSDMCQGHP